MNKSTASVPFVVQLPAALARDVAARVDAPNSPYESVSDYLTTAARNHLALEAGLTLPSTTTSPVKPPTVTRPLPAVHTLPESDSFVDVALVRRPACEDIITADPMPQNQALSFLTNRAAPFQPVARIAANLRPASPRAFIDAAADVVREIGLRLQEDDQRRGLGMADRRATSYPTGAKPEGSKQKFAVSYLFDPTDLSGPAFDAGILTVDEDGRIVCTPAGAELAAAPNGFLDGCDEGERLSFEASNALINALLANEDEVSLIRMFCDAVSAAKGVQPDVDAKLKMDLGRDVSDGSVTSLRAALIGRLRDLGIADVSGRGTNAVITIYDASALLDNDTDI